MRNLSSIVLFLALTANLYSQSPHGSDLRINCAACHSSSGWEVETGSQWFDHDSTNFPLQAQHTAVDCKSCHESLVFVEANTECISCHTDLHNQTVGTDCARCHSPENWLVDNITELHLENGFPLLGPHNTVSCVDCHVSETRLRFDRIGNDCVNCHLADYSATSDPNHQDVGFSTTCSDCHVPNNFDWSSEGIKHDFFPIFRGKHRGEWDKCSDCHTNPSSYKEFSCIVCHTNPKMDKEHDEEKDYSFDNTACYACHPTGEE